MPCPYFITLPVPTAYLRRCYYTDDYRNYDRFGIIRFTQGGYVLHFTSFLDDGRLTVALTGEIDHHCAKGYIEAIAAKIEAYTPDECILDFSEVSFMDSSGIAVVINALRNMTQIEGT